VTVSGWSRSRQSSKSGLGAGA